MTIEGSRGGLVNAAQPRLPVDRRGLPGTRPSWSFCSIRAAPSRDAAALADGLPTCWGWEPPRRGEDALLWVAARYLEAILQRLNQAPEKNRLAFLDLLGVRLTPAQAARAPIVLQVAEDAPPLTRAPAGTQLSAEPPPESTTRVVFETETGVGFTRGRLQQVVSLWAGRDQYADYSAVLAAGEPFQSFFKRELQDTPHHIYIAHNPLLAIAGEAEVSLQRSS